MNIKDKKDVLNIIEILTDLKKKAEFGSNTIINPDEHSDDMRRAKSEGYASAYSYCIMLLDDLLYGKKMDYKNLRKDKVGDKNEDTSPIL